jgi:threonine dehydratase
MTRSSATAATVSRLIGTVTIPTLADVESARDVIAPYLRPTPLLAHAGLRELLGTDVLVKHDNHLPTGAFKVRGGVNLVAQAEPDELGRGLIAASTGNHGQSVAYAGKLLGARVIVCVPVKANPAKVHAIRALGAEIVEHGRDFDDAREHCEALAAEHGYRYVHSGNEPRLIAGVGTQTLEILAEHPDVDVIVIPIGGGSGAAGACIVSKAVRPACKVIGVQSAAAPAAFKSWETRSIRQDRMGTAAEGLATRVGFELPQEILWKHLDDFVLVGEEEIFEATRVMIEHTRNLVEGAAAAPLAAALRLRDQLAGKRVVLVCSGGNITIAQLRQLL